ncbi:YihY/virulence factor BrkB family protein [Algivirga pacifica]|uniref:Uncharacterized protein n=1 Tax=Algivirga pacifica TaxID=1162670 RepID=A0ABP9CZV6_9BACT
MDICSTALEATETLSKKEVLPTGIPLKLQLTMFEKGILTIFIELFHSLYPNLGHFNSIMEKIIQKIIAHLRLWKIQFHSQIHSETDNFILDKIYMILRVFSKGLSVTKAAFKAFGEDKAYIQGAAISYYTVFSLPPILYFIISMIGLFYEDAQAKATLLEESRRVIGPEMAQQLSFFLDHLSNPDNQSTLKALISIGSLAFSASIVFYTLQTSINTFWKVDDDKKGGIGQLLIDRIISFTTLAFLGLAFISVTIVETTFLAVKGIIENYFGINIPFIYELLNSILPYILFTVLFAMLFKYLPNAIIRWRDLWVGSFVTAILFILGQKGIAWYINSTDVANAYGAANSIIILLAWVFYSSQIVYFGAEFIYIYATKFGNGIHPASGLEKFKQSKIVKFFRKHGNTD